MALRTPVRARSLYIALVVLITILTVSSLRNELYIFGDNFHCPDCNILLISIDTLRADRLGLYGYERDTSPFLDEFGEKSVVFEHAISQATWTLPSQASIFTSLYPYVHGLLGEEFKIKKAHKTLAEVLKEQNYSTAAFVAKGHLSKEYGFSKGFDSYKEDYESAAPYLYSFSDTLPAAQEWIDSHKGEKFFLLVHGYDLHTPYTLPRSFARVFAKESYEGVVDQFITGGGKNVTFQKIGGKNILFDGSASFPIGQEDLDRVNDFYDASLLYADSLLETFLKNNEDLLKKTIVIVYSDHGETLFDHYRSKHLFDRAEEVTGHGDVYDEVIHVPLIMYHPHLKPRRVSQLVEMIDIAPTILKLLGIPSEDHFQGSDMTPTLKNKPIHDHVFTRGVFGRWAVRSKEWKLIEGGGVELYDLKKDPKEQKNVAEDHLKIVDKLKDELFAWKLANYKILSESASSRGAKKSSTNFAYPWNGYFTNMEGNLKKIGGHEVEDITGGRGNHILKMKIIREMKKNVAISVLQDKVAGIDSLFVSKPAPYPGVITKSVICPKEFHPLHVGGETDVLIHSSYEIYANERFSYGVCSPDLLHYKSLLSYVYCKRARSFLTIEIFTPINEGASLEEYRNIVVNHTC